MTPQDMTATEQIFSFVIPKFIAIIFIIVAIAWFAKFLSKQENLRGKIEIYWVFVLLTGISFLDKFTDLIKYIVVLIIQPMVTSAQAANKSIDGYVSIFKVFTDFNLAYVIALVVFAITAFILCPKSTKKKTQKNLKNQNQKKKKKLKLKSNLLKIIKLMLMKIKKIQQHKTMKQK